MAVFDERPYSLAGVVSAAWKNGLVPHDVFGIGAVEDVVSCRDVGGERALRNCGTPW
ncbi:hypothetical protein ACWDOR_15820 [Streptosporangium canum]|uniref:hypothetical protein n=1 Tax=Streptosporangium canum TaxID=324952 RepID=UPI0036BE9E67